MSDGGGPLVRGAGLVVQDGQEGGGGGLATEDQRAQGDGQGARGAGRFDFAVGKIAFGADPETRARGGAATGGAEGVEITAGMTGVVPEGADQGDLGLIAEGE